MAVLLRYLTSALITLVPCNVGLLLTFVLDRRAAHVCELRSLFYTKSIKI